MCAQVESADLIVRLATPSDTSELLRLRYALRASPQRKVVESEPDFRRRCEPWMRDHLAKGHPWYCWVAERESNPGHLLGAIWMQVLEKVPNPNGDAEEHAYITSFYIDSAERGGGFGGRMLRTVLDWCDARPVDSSILWPTDRSRPLYKRHGFASPEDIFERSTPR